MEIHQKYYLFCSLFICLKSTSIELFNKPSSIHPSIHLTTCVNENVFKKFILFFNREFLKYFPFISLWLEIIKKKKTIIFGRYVYSCVFILHNLFKGFIFLSLFMSMENIKLLMNKSLCICRFLLLWLFFFLSCFAESLRDYLRILL